MSNNNKKVWHEVFFSQLPTSEADPDMEFEFRLGDFTCKRGITIVPLGCGRYAGDILKGTHVTGEWKITPKLGIRVKSYLRVNDKGQCKRYARDGHVICPMIEAAVSEWLSRKRDGFFRAQAA